MVKLPKVPSTLEDFNNIVTYLRFGTFPATCYNPTKKTNFTRRCKNFSYDDQNGYLYYTTSPKDRNSPAIKKRVVPAYDTELREVLFEKFHVGAAHFDYHKTYNMLYKQHIGITQEEVQRYVRNCPTCIRNSSIKEKIDITPVVADGPLDRIQVDLVDLLFYARQNDGYTYILTMI
ncbi:MAG TPA: integrase zinc binding domain-containing protein, partial [Chlamydiales bacterium]|nr:integrase zinc binding domain-containing protein [Chlamydiales bacterium]